MFSPIRLAAAAFVLASLSVAGCAREGDPEARARLLAVGAEVPDVTGRDQEGHEHRLRALTRPAVVYFFPKSGTPGCTREACAFRDVWQRYQQAGVSVFGVSRDTSEAQKKFTDEHRLPFALISDESGAWAQAFGVKSTLGVYERVSFLLDGDGRIARVYPRVDPGVHAGQVLADASALR